MAFKRVHTGPLFREFIRDIVRYKNARSYLEIGVRDGTTLALIDAPSIGVDPAFQFNCNPMGSKPVLHLFQMTSDRFFRDHDPVAILGSPMDVVFLDGLHQFEYLLRDFINSEAVSHRDGLIMLDDCLPINAEMTERVHDVRARRDEDYASWWTGDVWKLLPILRKYRPDLRVTALDTSPTGNVCVTALDPRSTVLRERYYEIVDAYRSEIMNDATFERFYRDLSVMPAASVLHGFDGSLTVGA